MKTFRKICVASLLSMAASIAVGVLVETEEVIYSNKVTMAGGAYRPDGKVVMDTNGQVRAYSAMFKAGLQTNMTLAIATQKFMMTNVLSQATGGSEYDAVLARWYPRTTNRIIRLSGSYQIANFATGDNFELMLWKNGTTNASLTYHASRGTGVRITGNTWTYIDTQNTSTNDYYEIYIMIDAARATGGSFSNNWWSGRLED
jgi:hypothetical protein